MRDDGKDILKRLEEGDQVWVIPLQHVPIGPLRSAFQGMLASPQASEVAHPAAIEFLKRYWATWPKSINLLEYDPLLGAWIVCGPCAVGNKEPAKDVVAEVVSVVLGLHK